MNNKFYVCEHCGNIVSVIRSSGVPLVCCGEEMKELVPGTVDASREKHVPVWTVRDGIVCVRVGETPHPMTEAHSIRWIVVRTRYGGQIRWLQSGEAPEACFFLDKSDMVEAVYAFCNLHGLWMS